MHVDVAGGACGVSLAGAAASYFCHDKFCRDKHTFVGNKTCVMTKHVFVATKHVFVMRKTCFS